MSSTLKESRSRTRLRESLRTRLSKVQHPFRPTTSPKLDTYEAIATSQAVNADDTGDTGGSGQHPDNLPDVPTPDVAPSAPAAPPFVEPSPTPLWGIAVDSLVALARVNFEETFFGLIEHDLKNAEAYLNTSTHHSQLKITPSNAYVERIKMLTPIIASAKPVAMAIAGFDPHKIAPYVVAGAFFLIELGINTIPPDERVAIEELFASTDTIILRWARCEMYSLLRWSSTELHPTPGPVASLRIEIPKTYTMALKLQHRIRKSCRSTRSVKGEHLPSTSFRGLHPTTSSFAYATRKEVVGP